jgi:hypothetical protein
MRRTALLVMFLFACGKDSKEATPAAKQEPAGSAAKPAEPAKPAGGDPAALALAQKNLPMLEKALAEAKMTTAMFECPETLKVVDEVAKSDKALADKVKALCTHDIYMAEINAEVAAIEAERAADAKKRRLDGCYQMRAGLAENKMTELGTFDDAAKAQIAKRTELCLDPKAKK